MKKYIKSLTSKKAKLISETLVFLVLIDCAIFALYWDPALFYLAFGGWFIYVPVVAFSIIGFVRASKKLYNHTRSDDQLGLMLLINLCIILVLLMFLETFPCAEDFLQKGMSWNEACYSG